MKSRVPNVRANSNRDHALIISSARTDNEIQ